MKFKILFILLILPLVLSTQEEQKNYFSVKKIWDGVEREYLVFLPGSYLESDYREFPVLIGLHGYSGTASGFELETTKGLNLMAEEKEVIVIYPQGSYFTSDSNGQESFVSSWNDIVSNADPLEGKPLKCSRERLDYPKPPECKNFNFCAWTSCNDDLGFLKSVIEEISLNYRTDDSRRYMIGMSNGGAMVYRFACKNADLLTAAAIVSSSIPVGTVCKDKVSLPLLIVYGEKDRTTPPNGQKSYDGFFYESVEKTFSSWANDQNCEDNIYNLESEDLKKRNVSCSFRQNCKNDSEVRICEVKDGGHFWPGQKESVGFCNTNVQNKLNNDICDTKNENSNWGNDLIWNFLERYKRF
tara:strand:- start:52 stop:1119 length:1068 start_codon:yes stop_codon:yes gene_type:complete